MIRLNQTIVVEGKYDKIKLENFIDAFIIATDGFRIFKNKEKRALLSSLAKKTGIIIMTDSDSAGMMIRSHIRSIAKDGEVINVYLPQIKGKEKRKTVYSAEGFLGVEGLSEEIIRDCLVKNGVTGEAVEIKKEKEISKALLYELGLTGTKDCKKRRETLYSYLKLPLCMQTNALLDYLNTVYNKAEFERLCEDCLKQADSK